MPSPADMLGMLADLWQQYEQRDAEADQARAARAPGDGRAQRIASERVLDRIHAVEALAIASKPATVADAVAQLVLIHADVSCRCECHEDPDMKRVPAILEGAVHALAVLARTAGLNLAGLGGDYLRPNEVLIARGEVQA